ncbi:DUF433 domain-containing protein [Microcoleus sp. D2_18a_B4]|uniref:DUF433 domain-containing protein n=1 Tax=Microcoleus sp. D2_18a_B4 TaxID=3055329 RepID=UPI002FD5D807
MCFPVHSQCASIGFSSIISIVKILKFITAVISIDIGTLITRTPGLHGGCPHILGKGVTVRRIVTWYKRG